MRHVFGIILEINEMLLSLSLTGNDIRRRWAFRLSPSLYSMSAVIERLLIVTEIAWEGHGHSMELQLV